MKLIKTIRNALVITAALLALEVCISCRAEKTPEPPRIEKLQFAESKKSLAVGEQGSVGIAITPAEARAGNPIEYGASVKGIIEINKEKSSSEGAVFTAAAPGSVVLFARSGGVVDYCDITVTGETEITIPYISLTETVLEIPVGKKRYVAASLQGGSPADQSNFTYSNSNDSFLYMESANNTVVLEGLKKGMSRVTIGHPKAQYTASCVVFVVNEGENAKYITGENVAFMELSGGTREYSIRLAGFDESEYANIIGRTFFQVIEGQDIIEVLGIGASCTIKAKSAGIAKVQVRNQAVTDYTFEFQVVVQQRSEVKYIQTKQNFYIINDTDYVNFNVTIEGEVPGDWADKFKWRVPAEYADIIVVEHFQDRFAARGVKNGQAVLIIENEYTGQFPCEILFIVQNQKTATAEDGLYIKTSQTVIQMEAGKGAPDAILVVVLVGGTSADQNNFEWVVEDSSIISVAASGIVSCKRSDVNAKSTYEAQAIITAKKPGTTRIKVSNKSPLCLNDVTVMVKVYPYGTFNGQALYLGGPSILKLKEGTNIDVYTPVIGGNASLLGLTTWESKNPAIAVVTGSGLHGNVQAIAGSSGVTKLKVTGENIAQEFEAVIVVYREGEEDLIPFIYTDNISFKLTVGQTIRIPVRHPNIPLPQFEFSVQNTNKQSVCHVVSGDVIIVSGSETGSGELVIQTKDPACNDLSVAITVESEKTDETRPFTITAENYKGMEEGQSVSLSVGMAGASVNDLKKIFFSIDDTGIARVKDMVNNEVTLEGVKEGQTVLRVNHAKSVNEKVIVIYVVKKGQSVEGKVILGIDKQNHVIMKNQSLFLKLITNAKESDLPFIRIKSQTNAENIHVDWNYDSMLVTGVKEGASKITVWCVDGGTVKSLIDLDIFITVKEEIGIRGELGFPDSIILVKDKYKQIQPAVIGVDARYIAVDYQFEDTSVASLSGSNLDVVIKGLAKGETYLQVACPQMSFFKKILVICAADEAEFQALCYFTVPKNLYRIKKGEQIQVNLNFGENGEPANAVYEWGNVANNDTVTINRQLKGARITGKNEGQAVIHVTCPSADNIKPVEIIVEVSGTVAANDTYRFIIDSAIKQMSLADAVYMMPVSIYYGNEYYDDYDVYHSGVHMENGYKGIKIELSDESVADAGMGSGDNSQFLRVTAKKAGRCEITLTHDMIGEPAKILVIVYDGEIPQGAEGFVFYLPQKYYLINKDETIDIAMQISGTPELVQSTLAWTNNTPEILSMNAADRANVTVTGIKSGAGSISARDGAGNVETVYVSVSKNDSMNTVSVATESVILLSKENNGEGYTTRIIVTGGSQNGIWWEEKKTDESIMSVISAGTSCVIYPQKAGITELYVKGPGFSKTIIVAITETEAEKMELSVMNVDQRGFSLSKGETVIINPYYRVLKPAADAQARPVFDNKVVSWQRSGKSFAFTGNNVGVQSVILSNEECGNEIALTFEVTESLSGAAAEPARYVYMTTNNPVILLEPGYIDYYAEIQVIGEYTGGNSDFIWSSDNKKVTLNAFGQFAFISVGTGEFKATVTVKNIKCADDLVINIIVGKKYTQEETTDPYLYAEKNVYTMNKSDSSMLIPLSIRNVANPDYSKVNLFWNSYIIECSFANGSIVVTAKDIGTACIEVSYSGALTIKLYIIVQETHENGAVYLTTSQNYVITNVNSTKAVTVNLVNYEEPDSAKITWKSSNTSVAHVIGSGKGVQILGVGAGYAKLTASHYRAFNDIEITVKVLPSGSGEDVCYLTTGENVIEAYVSANSRPISVSKIGGKSGVIEASWSVDNPSIVGVMGSNDIAYITPKKEGQARITVSEREAGALDIVVIVRKQKPGDLFIIPNSAIVQITPMSGNGVLSVAMSGIKESDEQKFQWQIYSQMPSDIEAARKGGQVVSLYAMGTRCTVNGIHAGIARIKITHPKAAEAAYIMVQVTNFKQMRFTQEKAEIVKNEMSYVVLETPDYENYADKVVFTTDNPSVASVIGTHKVALISAGNTEGTATITASIPDAGLTASVYITVVEERKFAEPEIVVNQSMFVLSPRELPFYVNANLLGFGVSESDQDLIHWELNFTSEEKLKPMLKLYPENVEGGKGFESAGNTVLVEIQQEIGKVYTSVEYCTLTVSCPQKTSKKRILYFQIQEDSNAFTISKKNMILETGQQEQLECTILNGSSKDYDEVVWTARRDSIDPGKDIVKVIGRGKKVQILGMTDGETTITASFRGLNSQGNTCRVIVKSFYYFSITYQTLLAFPGQLDEKSEGKFAIGYSIRPPNAAINWIDTASASGDVIANIMVGAPVEVDGTGQGKIYFDFLKEGSFTLIGTSNQKMARVNVKVENKFGVIISSSDRFEWPYKYRDNSFRNGDGVVTGIPEQDIYTQPTFVNETGYAIPYTVTPAAATLRLIENDNGKTTGYTSVDSIFARGWEVFVKPPRSSGYSANGFIYIKNRFEDKISLKFRLYKPDGQPVSTSGEYDCWLTFTSVFDNGYSRLIPVFQRVSGGDSNKAMTYINGYPGKSETDASAASSYARVFEKSGVTGEYLSAANAIVNKPGAVDPIKDEYNITITDGEEHYILLDKAHKDAKVTIKTGDGDLISKISGANTASVKINGTPLPAGSQDVLKTVNNNGKGLSADLVTLDDKGTRAIRVSGGKDFVVYNGFETHYDPVVELSVPDYAPNYNKTRKYKLISQKPVLEDHLDHDLCIGWRKGPNNSYNVLYFYYFDYAYVKVLNGDGSAQNKEVVMQQVILNLIGGEVDKHKSSGYYVKAGQWVELTDGSMYHASTDLYINYTVDYPQYIEKDTYVQMGYAEKVKISIYHPDVSYETIDSKTGKKGYTLNAYIKTKKYKDWNQIDDNLDEVTLEKTKIHQEHIIDTLGPFYIAPEGYYLYNAENGEYQYYRDETILEDGKDGIKYYTKYTLPNGSFYYGEAGTINKQYFYTIPEGYYMPKSGYIFDGSSDDDLFKYSDGTLISKSGNYYQKINDKYYIVKEYNGYYGYQNVSAPVTTIRDSGIRRVGDGNAGKDIFYFNRYYSNDDFSRKILYFSFDTKLITAYTLPANRFLTDRRDDYPNMSEDLFSLVFPDRDKYTYFVNGDFEDDVLLHNAEFIYRNRIGEFDMITNVPPRIFKEYDTLSFGNGAPTTWHILSNEFNTNGNPGGRITVHPNIYMPETNGLYFKVNVNNAEMRRVVYDRENDVYSNDIIAPFTNADTMGSQRPFYVRYLKGNNPGSKTVYNFLYNQVQNYDNSILRIDLIRNPLCELAVGTESQQSKYAYTSHNLNAYLDGNLASYWNNETNKAKYAYADISNIHIKPMTENLSSRRIYSAAQRHSTQKLTEFPLGYNLPNSTDIITLFNIREKINGNGELIFKPSAHQADTVVSEILAPLVITYATECNENNTLTVNVKYQIKANKANLVKSGGSYVPMPFDDNDWDKLEWEKYDSLGIKYNQEIYNGTTVFTPYEKSKGRCFMRKY
jgi:hypothetical protein